MDDLNAKSYIISDAEIEFGNFGIPWKFTSISKLKITTISFKIMAMVSVQIALPIK